MPTKFLDSYSVVPSSKLGSLLWPVEWLLWLWCELARFAWKGWQYSLGHNVSVVAGWHGGGRIVKWKECDLGVRWIYFDFLPCPIKIINFCKHWSHSYNEDNSNSLPWSPWSMNGTETLTPCSSHFVTQPSFLAGVPLECTLLEERDLSFHSLVALNA